PSPTPTPNPEEVIRQVRSIFPNSVWAYGDLTGWEQVTPNTMPEPTRGRIPFQSSILETLQEPTSSLQSLWR
ncbi:MAG: hypothetical protein HY329_03085, partial [Chloroflexi bacterium]|nr:hypothetical protein [Chloroflexota bacterium]